MVFQIWKVTKQLHETHHNYSSVAQQTTSSLSNSPTAIPHRWRLYVLAREESAAAVSDCHQLLHPDQEVSDCCSRHLCWKFSKNWENSPGLGAWTCGSPLQRNNNRFDLLAAGVGRQEMEGPDGAHEHFMTLRLKELVWGLGRKSLILAFADIYPHN